MSKHSARNDARRQRTNDRRAEQQGELNFAEAESPFQGAMSCKRAQLRRINPKLLIDENGDPSPMSDRRWRSASEVLLSIYAHAYNSKFGWCQARPQRISETAHVSLATFYELRSELEKAGLLIVEPGGLDGNGDRQPSKLTIDDVAIEALAEASSARRGNRYAKVRRQTGIDRNRSESTGLGRTASDSTGIHKETLNPLPVTNKLPPPPSPSGNAGDARSDAQGGGRLVEVLKAEGVGLADEAAAAFRSAGGTLRDALAIVEAYRGGLEPKPPAWSAAALYYRLTRWRPGQDPREGWPPPDEGHVAAQIRLEADQRRREADREASRLQAQRRSRQASRRVEQSRLAELEAKARAKPRHEYAELIDSIEDDALRRHARRNPFAAAVLDAIADRLGVEDLDAADQAATGSRGPPSLN